MSCEICSISRKGKLDLGVAHLSQRDIEIDWRTHLIGVQQLLEHQATLTRPDLDDVLLGPPRSLGERAPAALLHRHREAVGVRASFLS